MITSLPPQWACREAAVRQRAVELHQQDRLFTLDPGADELRPAQPIDVLHALGYHHGALYVATARGTTQTRTVDQSVESVGIQSWGEHAHRIDTRCDTSVVQYAAIPVSDVDYFLSLPMSDRAGRSLPGVAVGTLAPGMGTVEVHRDFQRTEWTLDVDHQWSSAGAGHSSELSIQSDTTKD